MGNAVTDSRVCGLPGLPHDVRQDPVRARTWFYALRIATRASSERLRRGVSWRRGTRDPTNPESRALALDRTWVRGTRDLPRHGRQPRVGLDRNGPLAGRRIVGPPHSLSRTKRDVERRSHAIERMMIPFDLMVRGGDVVTPWGAVRADVGIRHGRIVDLGFLGDAPSQTVLDAEGLHVLPGIIDSQVHFRGLDATAFAICASRADSQRLELSHGRAAPSFRLHLVSTLGRGQRTERAAIGRSALCKPL